MSVASVLYIVLRLFSFTFQVSVSQTIETVSLQIYLKGFQHLYHGVQALDRSQSEYPEPSSRTSLIARSL